MSTFISKTQHDTHTHTYTYTHTHTHTHTHTSTHKHTDTNCMQRHTPHARTHTHIYTHSHAHRNAHTNTHTHTHTHTQAYLLWVWWKQKKENDKSVGRRERVDFQFWLERAEWRVMPDRERKRVPDDRSAILKWSLPKSPSAHPWDTENPSIWGWTKRRRRRIKMKQLREVWRSCTRNQGTGPKSGSWRATVLFNVGREAPRTKPMTHIKQRQLDRLSKEWQADSHWLQCATIV